jgi:hypothetical protein
MTVGDNLAALSSHLKETSDIVSRQMRIQALAGPEHRDFKWPGDRQDDRRIRRIHPENGRRPDDMFNFLSDTSGQITSKKWRNGRAAFARLDDTSCRLPQGHQRYRKSHQETRYLITS